MLLSYNAAFAGSFVKLLPWQILAPFLFFCGIWAFIHVIKSPKRYPALFRVAIVFIASGCGIPGGIEVFAKNTGILISYIPILELMEYFSLAIGMLFFMIAIFSMSRNDPDPSKRNALTVYFILLIIALSMMGIPILIDVCQDMNQRPAN